MNANNFQKEYSALFTISTILKLIGIILLLAAIVGIIYGIVLVSDYEYEDLGPYVIIGSIVFGLLYPIIFFGSSELIKLFIRIEINTRKDISNDRSNKNINVDFHTQSDNDYNSYKSFDEWKKENPNKSINEYYASMGKKK
jgi:hypothetical protein